MRAVPWRRAHIRKESRRCGSGTDLLSLDHDLDDSSGVGGWKSTGYDIACLRNPRRLPDRIEIVTNNPAGHTVSAGNPKWISGDSETVESENRDVIGLAEASRLFGDALSCLPADLTSTLEPKQLASRVLRLHNPVRKQCEAISGL